MTFFKSSLQGLSWVLLAICFSGILWTQKAYGEASLAHEVDRLKRQLLTLEQNFYKNARAPSSPPAGSFPPLAPSPIGLSPEVMEKEIQRLTSELEEARHTLKLQQQEIRSLKNDIELRLSQLEKKKSLQDHTQEIKSPKTPPRKEPESKTLAPSPKKGPSTPETALETPAQETVLEPVPPMVQDASQSLPDDAITQEYNESLALLKGKDYSAARQAFTSFIKNHSTHDLAGNAQFWLGEALAALQDYTQASVAFLAAYKNYPNNPKRADSLLKLAHCLGQLGKQKEACATLQKLSVDFPQSSAIQRLAAEEKKANGCL